MSDLYKETETQAKTSRWIYVFLGGLLVSAVLLSWWGTRMSTGEPQAPTQTKSVPGHGASTASISPATPQLLAHAAALNTMHCAGCHSPQQRLIGPAYQEIAAHYQNPGDTASLATLAARIDHPLPGWNDYPRGPPEPLLSGADRLALAQWIVHNASPSP